MYLGFPLGEYLLEPTLYLVLATLPSVELFRKSSPEAQCRDQGLQRSSVKFLGKAQDHISSPDEAIR